MSCPECGVSDLRWCPGHKIKVKGGYSEEFVYDVCLSCGYESEQYAKRPVVIMKMPKRPEQEQITKEEKKDSKIVFTAAVGDAEISIKVGKEGLSKLLSMFLEV